MVGVVAGLYFIEDQGIKLNLVFWALVVFLPEISLLHVTPAFKAIYSLKRL